MRAHYNIKPLTSMESKLLTFNRDLYRITQVVIEDPSHHVSKNDAYRILAKEHVQSSCRASRRTADLPHVLRLDSLRTASTRGNAADCSTLQVLDGDIVA